MYYLTQVIKYKIILRNQINYEIDSTKCKYFNRRQISYVYFMTEDDNMPTQHDKTQHDKTLDTYSVQLSDLINACHNMHS